MHLTTSEPQSRRWTVEEYYRLWEGGFFQNERVELINGEILRLSPHNPPHSSAVAFLNNLLVRTFGNSHIVRVQLPLCVPGPSEPEPDFSLVRPEILRAAERHPTSADLVIEVSHTSLSYDRRKAGLYASAQVAEYWIVNVAELQLEVYKEPRATPQAEFGWSYTLRRILLMEDTVSPSNIEGELAVSQLFDWPR
jgi:Uma2 family endonuclease